MAARRGVRPLHAALLGFITGCVYFGAILYWVLLFGRLPWALLTVVEALWFALFAWAASVIVARSSGVFRHAAVPITWTAVQWLRSLGPYAFTWGSFAHTQANALPIIQVGALTGPWGIDFFVCTANLILANTILPPEGRRRWRPLAGLAVVTALLSACYWIQPEPGQYSGRGMTVAIVQPSLTHTVNPPPDYAAHAFDVYRNMSLDAAKHWPSLIVWPETALTTVITQPGWGAVLSKLAAETRTSYLVGGYDATEDPAERRSYNAAHLYGPDGRKLGVYRKVRLVPYGEFVPMRDSLPWLRNYGIRDVDVLPGTSHKPLELPAAKIGVAICFESLFPGISRSAVRQGAEALFVLTNDSWFGRTQAAKQHLMMARLRAVETRRYAVRAASTGISAVIDPYGRVCERIGIFQRGSIVRRIGLRKELTCYVRWGDWFAYLCAAWTIWRLPVGGSRISRRQRTQRPGFGTISSLFAVKYPL